ncbi:hypothetical protein C6P45_001953 [Maudiozyma exigua]|uniref:Uncharacterized protein n=1 Tax=Maudiozyma exigua TaxID=34358 RepID=A0A9P6WFM5_MAUEX|nr:hypothetical protein C6P45_001953 [Kazachstania exigua]
MFGVKPAQTTFEKTKYYRDEMLDYLEKKPIFNNVVVSTVSGFPTNQEYFICSNHDGSKLVTMKNTQLRWGYLQKQKFNTMKVTIPTNFGDQKYAISESRNTLCVFNKNGLKVVEIPWGYSDINDTMSFGFQSGWITFDSMPHIREVMFHPRSIGDNTLVVLFENDTIMLYDLDTGNKVLMNQRDNGFGFGTVVSDIKSMTFSRDGLTLYLLSITDGGDIYALYPCLPSKITFDEDELKTAAEKAVLLYDSLGDDTKDEVKRNVIRQYKFISDLKKQNVSEGKTDFEMESEFREAQLQGPFTISPYPDALYETTAKEIHSVNIGLNSEVILLTFCNGTILILFQDEEMSMCWNSKNYVYSNSMVVIENAQHFGQSSLDKDLSVFKSFNETNHAMIACSERGINIIDMSKWGDNLDKAITNADLNSIKTSTFKSLVHQKMIFHTAFPECAVWRVKGKTGIIVSGPKGVKAELMKLDIPVDDASGHSKEGSPILATETTRFQSEFAQPIREIQDLTVAYVRRCQNPFTKVIPAHVRQQELANSTNEVQLDALTTLSTQLGAVILQGESLGVMLHSRLLEQQFALSNQIKGTSDILEKQETLVEKYEIQKRVLTEKMAKQDKLVMRIIVLNQKVNEANKAALGSDNVISEQEMMWFKDIRNQIFKFNEFVRSQKALQSQLNFVKQELSKLQTRAQTTKNKTDKEWDELRKILESDASVIKQCNEELQKTGSAIGA